MPSGLAAAAPNTRAIKQALADTVSRTTIAIRGPFFGYMPDVDPNVAPDGSATALSNVVARPKSMGHGEVLTLPDGYKKYGADQLPLGALDGDLPAAPVSDATSIVRLDQIARFAPTTHGSAPGEFTGEFIQTAMAVTSGTGVAGSDTGNMYRFNASGDWVEVAPSAAGSFGLTGGRDGPASANISGMPDSCTAPFGAIARTAHSGAINEPCWILTNNVDEVMVFPTDSTSTVAGTHEYEPITDLAALDPFLARSAETWNGRVYYLNTSENGTRYSQRLRRSAKFTADPTTALVGSGHYDFRKFQGAGLRIETLGSMLACYFQDGVALMQSTGNPLFPDEPFIVSTQRGLLSSHAMTPIDRSVHFGIFTDGWWLLDQSGRWQEVGIESINGVEVPKWRETFYERLDEARLHRIQTYYDSPSNLVYITVPVESTASDDIEEVWIFDPISNRVFIENYQVTCFGGISPQLQSGTTIDNLTGTIDGLTGSIDSYAAVPGFPKTRLHGDASGYVYEHRRDIDTFDGQIVAWSWEGGMKSPLSARYLTTGDRMVLEYFNVGNEGLATASYFCSSTDQQQQDSARLNSGSAGDLRTRNYWFRFTSPTLGYRLSGGGPFEIRSVEMDLFTRMVEHRGIA